MKGIILAGGKGTRLYPITQGVCKQLLPVYDKPMIFYPLSVLMLAGIREVLIISTCQDLYRFKEILGCGNRLGMDIKYQKQPSANGIAQALILGEGFIAGDDVCLILGDNFFYGDGLIHLLKKNVSVVKEKNKAVIFAYKVAEPEHYGVVEFDSTFNVLSIEEKPEFPKSKYAVTGLYFYPGNVTDYAAQVMPSERGELEITSVNNQFLMKAELEVELLGRGFAWLDAGTYDSLLEAGQFVQSIERRQGNKIACIEEIAWKNGWISSGQLEDIAVGLKKCGYGNYLLELLDG